jgi:hypothetical protein
LGLAVVLGVGGLLGGCGYDQVVHTWVAYSEESSVPEGPKLPGHMYLVRGLTSVYSFGIDQLAAKINHRGVTATVYSLSETGTIANDIARKYKAGEERGPIMLLGHSSGADYAIAIAERLKEAGVPVALAFGFDPTRTAAAVPGNVELFINLYQGANIIGGGEVQPGPDFRGRLIDVDLREHTEIVHISSTRRRRCRTPWRTRSLPSPRMRHGTRRSRRCGARLAPKSGRCCSNIPCRAARRSYCGMTRFR